MEPNARKIERVLAMVNNWRLGSRRMKREKWIVTIECLIEALEEMAAEEDGFLWEDEDI
jgi:hypothetical protein